MTKAIASWLAPQLPAKIPIGRSVAKLKMLEPVIGGQQAAREDAARFKLKTTEHGEQSSVIRWWAFAHKAYKVPEYALYAVPNAAKRGFKLAAMMKAEGMRKGALDLNLDVPAGEFHGLRLELKIKPNSVSAEQQDFLNYYNEAGYCAAVCWSGSEAIDAIKHYLARGL